MSESKTVGQQAYEQFCERHAALSPPPWSELGEELRALWESPGLGGKFPGTETLAWLRVRVVVNDTPKVITLFSVAKHNDKGTFVDGLNAEHIDELAELGLIQQDSVGVYRATRAGLSALSISGIGGWP